MGNMHVYLEDPLIQGLAALSEQTGKKRNALVREAVAEYIHRQQTETWPDALINYVPDKGLEPFERHRRDLLPPREDVL